MNTEAFQPGYLENGNYRPNLKQVILFYSNKSDACNRLREYLRQYQFASMDEICVDPAETREMVQTMFEEVPALLLVYDNGKGEKFEGNKVWSWFQLIISNHFRQQEELEAQRRYYEQEKNRPEPQQQLRRRKVSATQARQDFKKSREEFDQEQYETPSIVPTKKTGRYRKVDAPMPEPNHGRMLTTELDSPPDSDEESDENYGYDGEDGSAYGRVNVEEDYVADNDRHTAPSGRGRDMSSSQSRKQRNPIMDVAAQMAEQRGNMSEMEKPAVPRGMGNNLGVTHI